MATAVAQPGPPPQHAVSVKYGVNESSESSIPRGPTSATLNFYQPAADGSAPFNYVEKPPEGEPQRNYGDEEAEINLSDARGKESTFDLDTHAFATLKGHPHNPSIDWNDDESVKSLYYPEVEQLLLTQIPGSPSRVVLFDHTIRRARPDAPRAPVTRAHIDQTPKSARMRVQEHLSKEDAEAVLADGTRYRIINVWRPLNGAVESHPLAVADSQTVPDDDMVPVQHRYPHKTGETAAIRHNPRHSWWYWSGMGNDERMLLQCFDSHKPMNRVPHSAFVDPRSTEQSKARESIEVRALVLG